MHNAFVIFKIILNGYNLVLVIRLCKLILEINITNFEKNKIFNDISKINNNIIKWGYVKN
jgi:hypothetical protein